jgi:hypothetical protein
MPQGHFGNIFNQYCLGTMDKSRAKILLFSLQESLIAEDFILS